MAHQYPVRRRSEGRLQGGRSATQTTFPHFVHGSAWVGRPNTSTAIHGADMSADLATAPLRLLSFGPGWGCPSIDPSCTKAHAHLLFCGLKPGVDFAIEPTVSTLTALGELPVLQMNSANAADAPMLAQPHEIYRALAKRGHDPDERLTPAQRAESLAFQALVEERLGVALLYSLWEEPENYEAVVKPAFSEALPLPLRYYMTWFMRRRAHSQLARRRCCSAEIAYGHGEEALAALSARLANSAQQGGDYFFGREPTSVDASAFAYLTMVLHCPLPHDALRRKLQTHSNLVEYCDRIAARFFGGAPPLLPSLAPSVAAAREGGAPKGTAAASAQQSDKQPRTQKQKEFRRRSRNAVLGAVSAALLYSLATDAQNQGSEDDEGDES